MLLLMFGLALAYTPIQGITFEMETPVEEFEFVGNTKLRISSYRQENSVYYDSLFYKAIYSSTVVSLRKIESLGALDDKCSPNDLLEIYEISEKELNNSRRFPREFIGDQETKRDSLWGYFDPRVSEPGYNAIVLSPHTESSNYRILVHELAHHWYATFCLERYTRLSSEQFANIVQEEARWE